MVKREGTTTEKGRRFEAAAGRMLEGKGYRIVGRNVRFRRGEIDLVARSPEGVVAFVEVKGRSASRWGDPLDAVGLRKRREVEAVARWWIRTNPPAAGYRFDAVAVYAEGGPDSPPRVVHLPDAWRPGDPGPA